MKAILFAAFLSIMSLTYADPPIDPEFSLKNTEISEPPPLPAKYGIQLPFENYTMPHEEKVAIALPDSPMIMQICVITDNTQRLYQNGAELMQGCHRGDIGLNFFVLQPYQYWKLLTTPNAPLIPKTGSALYPSIVMNYIDSDGNVAGDIEIGISFNYDYIAINGRMFEHNDSILAAIYKLIDNVYNDSYIQ